MERYLAQPRPSGKDLVLPQSDVPDFVDSSWKALPSLRNGWMSRGAGGRESGNWDWYVKKKKKNDGVETVIRCHGTYQSAMHHRVLMKPFLDHLH